MSHFVVLLLLLKRYIKHLVTDKKLLELMLHIAARLRL